MDSVLQKIYRSGLNFLTPLSPEETYKTVIHEAVKLVKADYGSIFMCDEDGQLERVYANTKVLYSYNPRKRGNLVKTFEKNRPIVLDAQKVIKVHPELSELNAKSMIHIPIAHLVKPVGIMVLYSSREENITAQDLETLQLFGLAASLAIRKAQLFSENKQALEIRDRFISMASHELKTPMTTINGYIQLLKNKLANSNSTESRWINELTWESTRMTKLIHELLAVNRIKSGQLNFEWKRCNLNEINKRVLNDFKFSHPNRKLDYESYVESDPFVIGDFDKLIQILDNILDNAVKYSPDITPITFTFSHKNNFFSFVIEDRGRGIKKSDMGKILDWYSRIESDREGMGVGLSLAKYLIEAHRGSLSIKSKVNKGTRIEIKLPKAKI